MLYQLSKHEDQHYIISVARGKGSHAGNDQIHVPYINQLAKHTNRQSHTNIHPTNV